MSCQRTEKRPEIDPSRAATRPPHSLSPPCPFPQASASPTLAVRPALAAIFVVRLAFSSRVFDVERAPIEICIANAVATQCIYHVFERSWTCAALVSSEPRRSTYGTDLLVARQRTLRDTRMPLVPTCGRAARFASSFAQFVRFYCLGAFARAPSLCSANGICPFFRFPALSSPPRSFSPCSTHRPPPPPVARVGCQL